MIFRVIWGRRARITCLEPTMVKTAHNPLDPKVLQAAGVPLDDALWFAKVPSNRKVVALRQSRGQRILDRVRQHLGVTMPACSVPA